MPSAEPISSPLDAIVCGGGIVGAAAALGLLQRGDRVRWLRRAHAIAPLPAGYAARVYALSPGNLAWLRTLGVAPRSERMGSVRAMHIRGRHGDRLELSAQQAGVAELALIIESDHLLHALDAALAVHGERDAGPGDAQISALSATVHGDRPPATGSACRSADPASRPASCKRDGGDALEVGLDDGSTLATRLLIAADGAASPLRTMAGIDTIGQDYGHRAVVANFRCERPHRGIACQWFDNGAVLAWLPLPDQHISMVWSLPAARAEALMGHEEAAFTAQVAAAGEHRWGALTRVSPPQSFPLQRQRARRLTAARLALVGDAAHVVHPLAGQGMNLGLRDVRALLDATAGRRDPGDAVSLARYATLRRLDVHGIEALTDGLFRLFGQPIGAWLGGHGMGLLNHLAPLKSELVRQAMR